MQPPRARFCRAGGQRASGLLPACGGRRAAMLRALTRQTRVGYCLMPTHSRLARRLQLSCAAVLALAAGWVAWRWPHSPAQALAGAMLVLAVPSLVLGVELIIASWVSPAHGPVPPPSL